MPRGPLLVADSHPGCSRVRDNGTMWRNLLEFTDNTGRVMVGCAGVALMSALVIFVTGVVEAFSGNAATTLPYWLWTMGCAFLGGLLVFFASRRTEVPPR